MSSTCDCDGCRPSRVRSVAVIGAGPVGLAAVKSLLDEKYFDRVVCFEAAPNLGGVWAYDNRSIKELFGYKEPGAASAYASLRTNSSRDMMGFSDFPVTEFDEKGYGDFPVTELGEKAWSFLHFFPIFLLDPFLSTMTIFPPKPFNVYMTAPLYADHALILRYLAAYAAKFKLLDHVSFSARVLSLQRRGFAWQLTVKHSCAHPRLERYTFDAVMLATGQFGDPVMAQIEHSNLFTGLSLHAHYYRSPDLSLYSHFGKSLSTKPLNVVVIGIGNSAGDIALEIAQEPETAIGSVHVVARSGAYFVDLSNTISPKEAFDTRIFTRKFMKPEHRKARRVYFSSRVMQTHQHFIDRGMPAPSPSLDKAHVTLLKDPKSWLSAIDTKRIRIRPSIARFSGPREVEFIDGSRAPCDVVLHCTGYRRSLPQLDEGVGQLKSLHRHVMHPSYATLAVLANIDSQGSVFSVGEMQARWVSCLWAQRVPTPCVKVRKQWIEEFEARIAKDQPAYPLFVDYATYLDTFAQEIGCMPQPRPPGTDLNPLLSDGTIYPATYRLDGPNAWPQAKQYLAKL